MTHYITFPGLFDDILTVPTETFFGIKIYAVMIMVGFLLAALYAMARAKQFNADGDIVADILIFALRLQQSIANRQDLYRVICILDGDEGNSGLYTLQKRAERMIQ